MDNLGSVDVSIKKLDNRIIRGQTKINVRRKRGDQNDI